MKKRLFSLVLALTLCFGLTVPAMAYGDTGRAGYTTPVSSGGSHAGIIDTNGSLWMWGHNEYGQVGNGRKGDSTYQTQGNTYPCQATPVKVMDDVASFSCGGYHTAAVKTDGSLWVWGFNMSNQLGIAGAGDYTYQNIRNSAGHEVVVASYPCQTVPMKLMDDVVAVSCGFSHSAAIKTDGSVWTWGDNSEGALGNGTLTNSRIPVKVFEDAVAVSCGSTHTAAIKSDGSLWMWGFNASGQIGNGGVGNAATNNVWKYPIQTVPTKVMDNVATVSCGGDMTAAVKTDGTLWTWGDASRGNLGNGLFRGEDVKVPMQIDTNIAAVSALGSSGAITTDNTLKVWGENSEGQLGNGRQGTHYTSNIGGDWYCVTSPTVVMENVAAVSGTGLMVIVKTDGTVWVCGRNGNGELGDKSLTNAVVETIPCQTVPARLTGFTAKLPGQFTLVPGSTTSPPVNRFGGFTDVKEGDYFADAVLWALEKNITSGTSTTTFSPNNTCTTAEIITLIWRANGQPHPRADNLDYVDFGKYYAYSALWANQSGLVGGKVFPADKPCTRADVVTYLWKLAGSPAPSSKSSFTDVPANADYASAVAWAVEQKITSGTGGGKFSPAATCTRGQIVTFLHRAMG